MDEDAADREGRGGISFTAEVVVTIGLGLAAIVAAWAAYRSSLVGDEMITNFNQGIKAVDEASQAYTEANQHLAQDQAVFLEYAKATAQEDADLAAFIEESLMSEDLKGALEWWQENDAPSPFVPENPSYVLESGVRGEELDAKAAEHFELARQADEITDRFDLVTVLAATVLFFLGLASVVRRPSIARGTAAVGFALLAVSVVQTVRIELA